jgi:hypothetical protein
VFNAMATGTAAMFQLLMMMAAATAESDAVPKGPGRGAPGRPRKIHRNIRKWSQSLIWEDLTAEGVDDPHAYYGKMFRNRYRVPHTVFKDICAEVKSSDFWHKFRKSDRSASGSRGAPVDVYVAASLRHMGAAEDFTSVGRQCNLSNARLLDFHHRFTAHFGTEDSVSFKRWVNVPTPDDPEYLATLTAPYTLMGFPGALGSLDGVHIAWERAPAGTRSWYTGKSGFPTLQVHPSFFAPSLWRMLECSHVSYVVGPYVAAVQLCCGTQWCFHQCLRPSSWRHQRQNRNSLRSVLSRGAAW